MMTPEDVLIDDREKGLFRVRRTAMTSEAIFERERQAVFGHAWLYVGHESEVPQPGDFVQRTVANRPVVLVRGRDGQVRVLYNSCTHRGAMVFRQPSGNADTFQCFYHGWTFDSTGCLKRVPSDEAYGGCFDKADLGLRSPARVEEYRGMWFMAVDPDIVPLADYLGDVREHIDLTLDSAEPLGGWEIIAGTADFHLKANWKLMVENSIDMYHFPTVHVTYTRFQTERRRKAGEKKANGKPRLEESFGFSCPQGHGGFIHFSQGRPIANESATWTDKANEEVRRLFGELRDRFGEQRAVDMAHRSRHLLIFPNMIFQDSPTGCRIRQVWPLSATTARVVQWEFKPRQEIDELTAFRRSGSRAFLGPGGMGSPDDVEALESCQTGYGATADEWNDLSRGMTKASHFSSDDEEQVRGFWRAWTRAITAPAPVAGEVAGAAR
jgi:p-cumate 2,3-dioxygenase alpha subunit